MKISRMIRRTALWMALVMLVLSCASGALAADGLNASHYKLMIVQRGTVLGENKANVREKPDADSDRLGRIAPGESVLVTGEEGDWWQVEFDGETGYVRKDLLTITETEEEVPVIVEDPLEAALSGMTAPTVLKYRNEYRVSGEITSNIPMTGVTVEIYNERTFSVDRSATDELDRDDRVLSYDLDEIAGDISFRKLDPGEKKLIISVQSANESMVVCELPFYVYTDGDPYTSEEHMTDDCRMEPDRRRMTDGEYDDTAMVFEDEDTTLTITLPENRTAEGLALHWEMAPSNINISFLGADDAVIETVVQANETGMIHFYYEVDEAVRKMIISTADTGKALCEARVYEKGRVAESVQKWQKMPEKLDLLVISTHQDDELLFFGGTIPYYAAQGKKVGVIYMADCGRERYAEALDGLWSCGLEYHPIFVGLEDKRPDKYETAVELWGMSATEATLAALIRKYQPEVIVTHDVDGEYGHTQHMVTSAAVQSAVNRAMDPTVDPASAEKYGLWTPKKLYIHLYEEKQITMEVYDQPMEELDGMTATEVATIGYSKHVSQQDAFTMEKHGVRYDNRKYGLAFTTVGDDVEKNDFFENID